MHLIPATLPHPIKGWGTEGLANGETRYYAKPESAALEAAKLTMSGRGQVTYNLRGDMDMVADLLADIPDTPTLGALACTLSYTQSNSPLGDIVLTVAPLVVDPRGNEHEEDVDYGSDGEGGTDHDIWSTQRNAKATREECYIEWDSVTHWPPFMAHGVQLMDPVEVTAYKLLVEGKRPGDVVSIGGQVKALKDHGASYDATYFTLLKEELLIWRYVYSMSWVISSKAHANRYDPGEDPQEETLPDGWTVSTQCTPNTDSSDDDTPKSWTVTRTWTQRAIYDNQPVPKGATLHDVRDERPQPNTAQ